MSLTQKIIPSFTATALLAATVGHLLPQHPPTLLAGALFVTLGSSCLGWFLARSLSRPLEQGVALAQAIEEGILTEKIESRRQDELGELMQALNNMSGNLRDFLLTVATNSDRLNGAAGELTSFSAYMSEQSGQLSGKAQSVAVASRRMSENMTSVSASASHSSQNAQAVAVATEEMTATIGEIAQSAERARLSAAQAVENVHTAANRVDELGQSAAEIETVINFITEISEQTKLLALNATIEAARAGEAGKGFAVVANEVKELAKQTSRATEEIRAKIEAMQQSMGSTVTEIQGIRGVIDQVNDLVSTIATAVEEQTITTRDIAQNIGQAASEIGEMTQNVAQSAAFSQGITHDVDTVSEASRAMERLSEQIRSRAEDFAKMSGELKRIVDKFRLKAGNEIFVWGPEYSVGIQWIDNQHRILIDLINRLNRAIEGGTGRHALSGVIDELVDYTKVHFGAEMELLRRSGYPEADPHARVHDNMVKQVLEIREKLLSGNHATAEVMNFLKNWLANHILKMDQQYSTFLQERGER